MRSSALFIALAATVAAAPAVAHPKLLSSSPAADTTVAPVSSVQLDFSERLVGQFSQLQVAMTDMPGMRMSSPMRMKGETALSADGKVLTITFARPLPVGTYKVTYQIVSADTHKIEGGYDFKVK